MAKAKKASSMSLAEGDPRRGRGLVRSIVTSPSFELFIGGGILSNAAFIGAQTDYAAVARTNEVPDTYHYINLFYTTLFTAEILLRLIDEGKLFFTSCKTWYWNYLDLFIVISSVVEAIAEEQAKWDPDGRDSGGMQSTSQMRVLRIIRITRLIKVIRITRFIRFIRALRVLVHQIASTMKSLVWAVVLLILVIFLFAIIFTQAATQFLIEQGDFEPPTNWRLDRSDPIGQYWSTLPRSMLSLYMTMTGGVDYRDIMGCLFEVGGIAVPTFIFFISFSQLAVLNVVTGVFCQSAIDSAQHDQDMEAQSTLANKKHYVNRLKDIFKDIDIDNSGSVTIDEFRDHLDDESVRAYLEALGLETSDVWTLFKLLDTDGGNLIELDEFISGCLRIKGNARGLDLAKLSYEFKWMTKRLATFMAKTESALKSLAEASAARTLHGSERS